MRVTIVYRYFWPDTPPYAEMLKHISAWLAEDGHDVRILTAQPAYKPEVGVGFQPAREFIDNVEVIRLPLLAEDGKSWKKILNSLLFVIQCFFRILFGRKSELVWTATMPPVFQAFAIMLAGKVRGARFLYHMQDIHPEISIASKLMKPGIITRIMTTIDRFTQGFAWRIVVLSEDMKQSIAARGIKKDRVIVVRNFSLGAGEDEGKKAAAPDRKSMVRFVFAGNIGRFQNLEALLDAFATVDGQGVELLLLGDGRAKPQLIEQVTNNGISNVVFHGHLDASDAFDMMCECHVGVVSLLPGLYKYAYPSKVLTYMAANLPILALVESESILAGILDEHQIGYSVSWDKSSKMMSETIISVAELARTGKAHPDKLEQYYHPEAAKKNWLTLLREHDLRVEKA